MEAINLNVIPGSANPFCHVSQFDTGRSIRVNLFSGTTVYTLDGTETISISVRKPDGHVVTEGITNTSDSYVEIITTEQMTACAGENLCELKIEKGSDTIGSLNFIMQVEKDPLDGGDPSESFVYDLQVQIAQAVADQYAAEDVVFDAAPTAGHGVGFAVTSEGVKAADDAVAALIPTELDDLSDVTYTGAPAMGEAVVWDGSKWTNGTVSTVGSIDDLNDVDTTGKAEGDSLRYDSGSSEWVAKPIVIEVTQAEYDQLVLDGDLQPLTTYVITDAPNLNATSEDLSYDGGTGSTWTEVESVKTSKADKSALTWTLLGETVGTAEQNLPASWNELQVYGMFGGNAQYGFVAHAISAHIGSNPSRYIQGGADKEGGTDHHIALWHIENGKIGLNFWRYNNTDYTSTAKLIVYYR